jgi:trehalose/maltose transport system permease protein
MTATARTQTAEAAGERSQAMTTFVNIVRRIPFYLLVAVIAVYLMFPFYWAFRSSITPDADLFATPVQYFPSNPTLENYRSVLSDDNFIRSLR